MQRDLGQGRAGWICLLTSLVLTAAFVDLRIAAAEDHHPDAIPEYLIGPDQSSGKYWIGVECREAPPELKSQLGLAEDEGLLVVHLTAEGPAAKAGLKRHDIIVSAGDDKLKRVPDLIKAVNAADGKEMSLKIIRAGKEQTIAVTPAERPKEDSQIIARPGPGFMFTPSSPPELPDDVTVTVIHKGKDPLKVIVTRGDEKWELDEKDLDKLPGELRPKVIGIVAAGRPPAMLYAPPTPYAPPAMRFEGVPNGDFHPGPFEYQTQRDGRPPRDGEHRPPPHDGNPPPRDGDGPPPLAGPQPPRGPGFSGGFQPPMMPGQIPPELMERLDRLDRQLNRLQDELRRMQDGGPGGMPRMRLRDGKGPDGPPPRDDQHGGPPRFVAQRSIIAPRPRKQKKPTGCNPWAFSFSSTSIHHELTTPHSHRLPVCFHTDRQTVVENLAVVSRERRGRQQLLRERNIFRRER